LQDIEVRTYDEALVPSLVTFYRSRQTGKGAMDALFFHELRRQASSFLTGKIRSARLALTDVTPTQL
jgi:hypothetical protein